MEDRRDEGDLRRRERIVRRALDVQLEQPVLVRRVSRPAKLRRPRSSPNQGTAGEVALLEELPTVETLDKNAETANKNPKPSAIEWAPYTDEEEA